MIIGIGIDICPTKRWEYLIKKFGNKIIKKIITNNEISYLLSANQTTVISKLSGRWAVMEAFSKATGLGLYDWNWKQLHFYNGNIWVEADLENTLSNMNVTNIHASLSHDAGIAFAIVILENDK